MSQFSKDAEGRKLWSTPALERLDLSGTRSGPIAASVEFTFGPTSQGAHTAIFHPSHS